MHYNISHADVLSPLILTAKLLIFCQLLLRMPKTLTGLPKYLTPNGSLGMLATARQYDSPHYNKSEFYLFTRSRGKRLIRKFQFTYITNFIILFPTQEPTWVPTLTGWTAWAKRWHYGRPWCSDPTFGSKAPYRSGRTSATEVIRHGAVLQKINHKTAALLSKILRNVYIYVREIWISCQFCVGKHFFTCKAVIIEYLSFERHLSWKWRYPEILI